MKKNNKIFFTVILSILIGLFCAKYVFNQHSENVQETFLEKEKIYLFQYGAYENKEIMEETCKNIKSYFYFSDDKNMYHVIIGISMNKEYLDKIKNAYSIDTDIYVKEETIDNHEFIESLKQYDLLVKDTEDSNTIINAEKQIMSKYEDLILKNE